MAEMIVCPLCGTENPPENKVCQRCQTPLSGSSFQPGQSPIQKDTGELEPFMPQWLRDARESAKASLQEPANEPPTRKVEKPAPSAPSGMDFLAGLRSQSNEEDDEEIPDWLASITGKPAPKPKVEEPQEDSHSRWVETGTKDSFQPQASEPEEEVPAWLKSMQQPAQADAGEKDELTDWFSQNSEAAQPSAPSSEVPAPAFTPEETPDWLKQMAADAGEQKEEPSPTSFDSSDWFSQSDSNAAPQMESSDSSGTPDWLNQLQAEASSKQEQESEAFDLSSGTPDWLSQMSADAGVPVQDQNAASFELPSDTPSWLDQMSADAASAESSQQPPSASTEAPDWLNAFGQETAPFEESTPAESEPFVPDSELPSWLKPETEATKKTDSTPIWLQGKEEVPEGSPAWLASNDKTMVPDQPLGDIPAQNDVFADMPDWLKAAAPQSSIFDAPEEKPAKPETPKGPSKEPLGSAPAFSEDAFPTSGDALFAEMPDWLSNAMESPSSVVPEPITGSDALAPDVLPSWVEAMRPSDDQGMANIVAASKDQTLESRGALAGLQGVLPAGSGFTPTSKPKAYSIKLNASEEQMSHAAILEQILAAETSPESLTLEKSIGTSRGLRWAITAILLIVALATTFMNSQFFSMPVGVPRELSYAVAVAQAIPENSPVLVAFDYSPSRAAEMEAAAAPLFDNLLLLKHPRLTFIASNETGAILAERFMTGPLAGHTYQSGVTYLNLGYLSGGQMGIRAFAQNPTRVAPLDISSQPAWTLPPLQGVSSLDQFAVIILVTDNADAARSWVEQTQDMRGASPVLVVASAQAAPMIQPYYESGQVAGMVSGLYGGAVFERQYNNGRPGTARLYWDAYSIGMLFAMVLLLGGGLFNLAMGLRERAALREGN